LSQQNSGTTGLSGLNGQLKLDLGGVVLGAIIGFGAIFILPKILHVFNVGHDSSGYGGGSGSYGYRSKWLCTISSVLPLKQRLHVYSSHVKVKVLHIHFIDIPVYKKKFSLLTA
jgi:hypothetical protein